MHCVRSIPGLGVGGGPGGRLGVLRVYVFVLDQQSPREAIKHFIFFMGLPNTRSGRAGA